ncbi:MAG TPA: Yip1 family protein [Caldimonas sp.]
MSLLQRVQAILLRPRETWPVIAAEPADTASLYSSYVIFLAAIPAIAGFIGMTLIGVGGFGLSIRIPIVSGLIQAVVSFVLSLVMVFLIALLVDALAPTFGGTKSQINALKLVAYGSTAGFVGGLFSLLPALAILGLIAALYSIYLIYTGLPVLMKCPPEKAGAYTAVVIVCAIVAMVVLAALTSLVAPTGAMRMGAFSHATGPGDVTIKTPSGDVSIDGSKMTEIARRMEEAGKRMEAAQKSGDNAAAGKAVGEMMGAMTGTNAAPIASQDLKAMLPDSLGDLRRESVEAQSGQAMGIGGSTAKAAYSAGERRIQLSITDLGGMGGLAAMAGWANMTVDRETDSQIEKVYKEGGRTVREEYRKDGSHGEFTTILGNGVVVEATGDKIDMPTLKKVVAGVDLAKIEALKRAAKP